MLGIDGLIYEMLYNDAVMYAQVLEQMFVPFVY
jgi:hypothetical protein